MKRIYVKPRTVVIELKCSQAILVGSDMQDVKSIHSQETVDGEYSL